MCIKKFRDKTNLLSVTFVTQVSNQEFANKCFTYSFWHTSVVTNNHICSTYNFVQRSNTILLFKFNVLFLTQPVSWYIDEKTFHGGFFGFDIFASLAFSASTFRVFAILHPVFWKIKKTICITSVENIWITFNVIMNTLLNLSGFSFYGFIVTYFFKNSLMQK